MVEAETTFDSLVRPHGTFVGGAGDRRPEGQAPRAPPDDNEPMASTEARLTWAAIALSVLLVLVLSGLAVYSVIGRDTEEPADVVLDDEEGQPGPPDRVTLQDRDVPLAIACEEAGTGDGYAVRVANLAGAPVDLVVSVELAVDGGRSISATSDVGPLDPGEERAVAVAPVPADAEVTGCSVSAVQSDRRLLLANS